MVATPLAVRVVTVRLWEFSEFGCYKKVWPCTRKFGPRIFGHIHGLIPGETPFLPPIQLARPFQTVLFHHVGRRFCLRKVSRTVPPPSRVANESLSTRMLISRKDYTENNAFIYRAYLKMNLSIVCIVPYFGLLAPSFNGLALRKWGYHAITCGGQKINFRGYTPIIFIALSL